MTSPAVWVALPLLGAFLLPIVDRYSRLAGAALGPAVLAVNALLVLGAWDVVAQGPVAFAMGGFAPPLGIALYVDLMALVFALSAALGGLLLWPRDAQDPLRERALTLLLVAGATGLALSGDLFNLYVFYEVMAVASYGLTAGTGSAAGYAAAVRFLLIGALGSALALVGIALLYAAAGTLTLAHLAAADLSGPLPLAAFALLLVGFAVKAELFPVNAWVPQVYGAASVRVSGLLAGVASKLALVVVLRLLLTVFAGSDAALLLLAVGMVTLASGELAAWRTTDLRRMLAYSSVGQLGVVAVAFSVSGSAGVVAGVAVALHHMLVKPAFFLLSAAWHGRISQLGGAARNAPLGAALFVLLMLSLIGVPPLPGFWAKLLVLKGLFGESAGIYQVAAALVLAMTVVEAAYLTRVAGLLYQRTPLMRTPPRFAELAPTAVLAMGLLVAMLSVAPLGGMLERLGSQAADADLYMRTVAPTAAIAPAATGDAP